MKLSLPQLKTLVANVVTAAKVSNGTYSVTRDNILELVDKIGKIVTLDSVFNIDKLADFDGEYLSFGKTVEEYQIDLTLPVDYDASGSTALAPFEPTHRPDFYSYTIGRKYIPTTLRQDNLQRAVHFEAQLVEMTAMILKRQADSMAAYRYGVKRQILGRFAGLCLDACDSGHSSAWNAATARSVGDLVYNSSDFGICVKAYVASDNYTWAQAIANGIVVKYNLVEELALPVDSTTGEAYVQAIKEAVEEASDISEGNSLNGNTLSANGIGLILFVKQGIVPALDVQTLAGAFHDNKLAVPAEIRTLVDFGDANSKVHSILMDKRAFRLFNSYRATREQQNGQGDFITLFEHTEDTAWISRNAFVRVFKTA